MSLSDRKKSRMRDEQSVPGFISRYLAFVSANGGKEGPEMSEGLARDVAETFSTAEGLRVLIMLEKSTLLCSVPDGADDRALREANAVRNFVLELRRYVAHG